ncbi:hypothetical protein KGF56_000101 [Candida oxycetoniae]|uniref:Sugar phosphate transporter domain-containing protein n=1 Tax=Candida oxycetoniae TaxID=497107 RepID=A0AAI9T1Y1_9ASCO|nr:uncharacterized protein KGF56_000101 [Candida oxycetoniae]KAI3407113.2 hypothetical protein KGF56_000101 [Candida oxycetoniae]
MSKYSIYSNGGNVHDRGTGVIGNAGSTDGTVKLPSPPSPPSPPKKKKSFIDQARNNMSYIYSSSQINPNYSSTNLSKINHSNCNNNPYLSYNGSTASINTLPSTHQDFNLPSPPSYSSYLMTPPYSESASPELAAYDNFEDGFQAKWKHQQYNNNNRNNDNKYATSTTITTTTTSSSSSSAKFRSLLPPINLQICMLCLIWYFCSIVSSNSIKVVLNNYKYPVTVTQFQFLFNIVLSLTVLFISKSEMLREKFEASEILPENKSFSSFISPSKHVIATTLPMGCFQFIGHLTSHKATSIIPVSLVHTIKALSPLITVLVYRFMFRKKYKARTFITLIPLVVGIMMTCYKPSNTNTTPPPPHPSSPPPPPPPVVAGAGAGASAGAVTVTVAPTSYSTGLIFAFISMLIFVSQNIFAKNKLSSLSHSSLGTKIRTLDNLTILFYCSIVGFGLTLPICIVSEVLNHTLSITQLNLPIILLIIINGLSHFFQSILAFQILKSLSPIDYSIANILKRIFIILISFIWESKNFTPSQTVGLVTTLFGLYCYDRWGTQRAKPV